MNATANKIRLLVGHHSNLMRLGLISILADCPDISVVAEASDGHAALKSCFEERPDIALLDVHLPGLEEIEAIQLLRSRLEPVRVIVLAATVEEREIIDAYQSGAWGYFAKSMPQRELVEAIRHVHAGECWIPPIAAACLAETSFGENLSSCERDILRLLPQSDGRLAASDFWWQSQAVF